MQQLSNKIYKKEFVHTFKGDDTGNLNPRQTPGVLYSKAVPTPVNEPKLLAWSADLANELGIQKPKDQKDIEILGGNHVSSSMYPYAARYGGHQFGSWAGQLGDGRAITLGEWEAKNGASYELQLKGAGPTPYSRRADGRAVLRSSVREYLMSEAMHHLKVPTTRALSLVSTGEQIIRDMFYNGNPQYEPGAIVMRVAPSFLRFGNFEILAAGDEISNLKKLVDWTVSKYYNHIQGKDQVLRWFREVVERTASLMVEWLRVGFVHGVMNTDNMSVLGLTIDYGPFSFVDDYDPDFTPNTTDLPGRRYAFGQQAAIALWNLNSLANAIAPLFADPQVLVNELEHYKDVFFKNYHIMLSKKLGLDKVRTEDVPLFKELELMLSTVKPDMTIFYQYLITLPQDLQHEDEIFNHFKESFYKDLNESENDLFINFIRKYISRVKTNTISREASQKLMKMANPGFIIRNYLLHLAIEELEKGEDGLFVKLQKALKDPYNIHKEFFARRPDWATKKAGCSMLSCSS